MKYVFVAIMLALGIALLGCTSAPNEAAPRAPQMVAPQDEAPVQPQTPVQAAPDQPKTIDEGPVMEEPAAPVAPCDGMDGNELVECTYSLALDSKDVTLCAGLQEKDSRFRCITLWCGSAARDFNQCEKLEGDDRLGCLNKCNPNTNT